MPPLALRPLATACLLAAVVLGSACGSSHTSPLPRAPTQTPTPEAPPLLLEDCDPMVPTECGFPFPSSVWTVDDATMQTGKHVYFGHTTLPNYTPHKKLDVTPYLDRDGFSPGGAILTHLPGATTTGLPGPDSIDVSVSPDSPTVLMEADTGARVPHFAELDMSTTNEASRAFMIHPAIRLKDATRYIVSIRRIVDANGQALAPNPIFVALRDKSPSTEISVAPRRALYADIMSKLQANGIGAGDLQLAWDFTTASRDNTTGWLIHMRDEALATVGSSGPGYTITKVEENPNPHIRRRLTGMMTVPLYLDQPGPGANLNLGPGGMPMQNGTADFPFLVHIPNSLVSAGKAGPIIENAHGLLGNESEGQDTYLADICDREGYVAVAVELVGMAHDDVTFIMNTIASDVGGFKQVIARQHQGLLNELLAMRMMMGKLATDPEVTFNGKSVIDTTQRFYRGDSQGGIFGGTFMAISTDVTRGLLGEPGAPYDLLENRSVDFGGFFLIIRGVYPNPIDIQLGLDIVQMLWDRTEPGGYVGYINQNMLPGTPQHQVLIHVAIGDHQVTPLGAHFVARTVGAQNLKAVNRELFGIPDADSGFTGSGMVEWDFGLPPAPITNTPMSAGADPHDKIRQLPEAQDMADVFFRTGVINQTCAGGGPCKSM
jgi:hypothetical protein